MIHKAFLRRFLKTDYYTIGKLQIFNSNDELIFECYTMELPYDNNQKTISCIPSGSYEVVFHHSPRFGNCYLISNVPNRSFILFHSGNFPKDTLGCVLVGNDYNLANPYQNSMLLNSKKAMQKLLSLGLKSFNLKISDLC